jgi:hypothetical protein
MGHSIAERRTAGGSVTRGGMECDRQPGAGGQGDEGMVADGLGTTGRGRRRRSGEASGRLGDELRRIN